MAESDRLGWRKVEVLIPDKDLLTEAECCKALEIGRDSFRQLIQGGKFPRPITLSRKTRRWRPEWVRWYLDTQELLPRLVAGPDEGETDSGGLSDLAPEKSGLSGLGPDSRRIDRKSKVEKEGS